ncbi:MAG TPA: histidine phosphatase family protein [Blastocatellia bacterium]|nr:histidine phosphatase family protein [Blastocatellia bacterium]HMV86915.1 histidine phosphatase family protein [Blastocatellia bacterium]HMY72340.1 histidine phosphatase family protein [Blastocatellia bacterium]HNG34492.1 histidine phosphatase family protein [Blastocatellia bacterium]
MQIYLIRHGQTEENSTGIIQGWNPGTLTPLGIEQAERLAERLKTVRFDAIYSSDSRRAADTAHIIARFHDTPVQLTEQLRERGMGVFQGRHFDEFNLAQAQSGLSETDFKPEGGENLEELQARAVGFVQSLRARHFRQTVLLVAHGRWNTMLLGAASGLSIEDALKLRQTNTCVNLLECDDAGGFTVPLLNCAAHLDEESAHIIATAADNS